MDKTPFALGFIKVNPTTYSIRSANVSTDADLTTAYSGAIPSGTVVDHQGGIVLGGGTDNGNNSWGTFYEGAIVGGYPTHETELAVMKDIQAVGYSK
jgi:non-reducing end alpha-L-arabinofuranosidase